MDKPCSSPSDAQVSNLPVSWSQTRRPTPSPASVTSGAVTPEALYRQHPKTRPHAEDVTRLQPGIGCHPREDQLTGLSEALAATCASPT